MRRLAVVRSALPPARWGVFAADVGSSSIVMATSKRCFIQDRCGHDADLHNVYQTLGFGPQYVTGNSKALMELTPEDIRRQFAVAVRKLKAGDLKEEYLAVGMRETPDDSFVPADEREKQRNVELQKLIDAYNFLMKSSYSNDGCDAATQRFNYINADEWHPEHLLLKPVEGEAFALYDEHHQDFQFTDSSTKSFGDFRHIFEKHAVKWKPKDTTTTPKPGPDVMFVLKLSFEEAVYGCSKQISFEREESCGGCRGTGSSRQRGRRCIECNGNGQLELPSGTYLVKQECKNCMGEGIVPAPPCTRCSGTGTKVVPATMNLSVKPGVDNLQTLKFRGKGNAGRKGHHAGNLVVSFMVTPHRMFHRDGKDLHIIAGVPLSVALLGGVIRVPTLNGTKDLRVPSGIESGTVATIEGFGIPHASGEEEAAGKLRVHLIVIIPDGGRLTGSQRGALDTFEATALHTTTTTSSTQKQGTAADVIPSSSSSSNSISSDASAPVASSQMSTAKKQGRADWFGGEIGAVDDVEEQPFDRDSFEGVPAAALKDRHTWKRLVDLRTRYNHWLPTTEYTVIQEDAEGDPEPL